MNKTASAMSHGKIILIGEHSVVYNNIAIALPLTANKVTVTVKANNQGITIYSKLYDGAIDKAPESLLHLRKTITKTLKELEIPKANIDITVDSNLPLRRGMGSSAAVMTAIIRAIYNYYNIDLSKEKTLELTDFSENIAHGKSSGIDARATINDKPILFSKTNGVKFIDINLNAYLVIADTGIEGETKKAVEIVKNNYPANKTLIDQLQSYTELALQAINDNNIVNLGKYITNYHKILAELGVSHPKLEQLIAISLRENALGAKLTGGGLGGLMIALCDNQNSAKQLAIKLKQEGAVSTWIQNLKL